MFERYELAKERIEKIGNECDNLNEYKDYFASLALYIIGLLKIYEDVKENGPIGNHSLEELRDRNDFLYSDILPSNYGSSFANPDYSYLKFGETGKYLSVLQAEIRGMIPYVFEGITEEIVIRLELFLEIFGYFEMTLPDSKVKEDELKDIFYYYVFDYTEGQSKRRTKEQLIYSNDYATGIVTESDWSDIRNLYAYGEYISSLEEQTLETLSALEDETISLMSSTYTEGFKRGFVVSGKDMDSMNTVNIRFRPGFEPVVKKAVNMFDDMGLKPVIYRAGYDIFSRTGIYKPGYYGALANPQYDEDHKEDMALVLDGQLVTRRLEGLTSAYEEVKKEALEWAGPACMEIFGEESFVPSNCVHAVRYGNEKQKLIQEYRVKSSEITNTYINREKRSFTIIAWPTPAIGDNFREILRGIIVINTLPVDLYKNIQQRIIDVLDRADYVKVCGMNGNETNLKVSLWNLQNPNLETSFENCLADVNIPLGEVFTSPVLNGTNGVLHVKEVFLNDLKFKNIKLEIEDGKIKSYSCDNYEDEKKNREFIEENLLFHHPTLPMGEFAIGTNTYAYAFAKKYDIFNKMPILIAEKMGPHFAFGDTCYSNEESVRVFNPDKKEMVAKENGEPYTYCHTDVTIPYDELGLLSAVKNNNEETVIIRNGRFVLEGTWELNKALGDI